jgi:integrase
VVFILKGSINQQLKFITRQLYGVGTSKKNSRKDSIEKDLNSSKNVSNKVHSFVYLANMKTTFRQLAEYAKNMHNVRDFEKISDEIVEGFIQSKIDKGLTKDSLDAYNSHLGKLQIALESIAKYKCKEYKAFTIKARQHSNKAIKDKAKKVDNKDRSYHSKSEIIDNIKNNDHKLVAKIQEYTGIRVAEASSITRDQLDRKSYTLTINGKGGKVQTVQLNKPLFNQIVKRVNQALQDGYIGFKVDYHAYNNDLKQAVKKTNQPFNSTHGFRYSHIQETYQNYILEGCSKEEALKRTSVDHNHERAEITNHYL